MNLGQVRTLLRGYIAEDNAAFFTDAFLNICIQRSFVQAYAKISNLRRGYFEVSTTINYVAAQELYTLPATTVKIVLVERIAGSNVVLPINLHMIDITEKNDYALQTGVDLVPGNETYFLTGNSIGIAPIPQTSVTAAIKIWTVPAPTLPTADSDTFPTELTDLHHEYITFGALMRAAIRDKQLMANIAPMYNELKTLLEQETQVRAQQEPPRIIDVDPFGQ